MSIKEIIRISALLTDRTNVVAYLDKNTNNTDETLSLVQKLLSLTNLVINELASTYIPLVKSETVSARDNKVNYSDLSSSVLKIKSVSNTSGKELAFRTFLHYVSVPEDRVIIEYEYVPEDYELNDTVDFDSKFVSARVIAYGVCAELAITESRFDEAVTWHKRYVDAISDICVPKSAVTKQRSWL